ncbi:hypothetical protein [Chitinimonas sp.]|uniref:hypothetical protein n=1 Tax=Chitinimonas sp. TaxID=1934313 RepID=UPI0035B114AB
MASSRQAFEAWAASLTWGYDSDGYPLGLNTDTQEARAQRLAYDWRQHSKRECGDDYWSDDTHLAWLAWQAAVAWLAPGETASASD